MVVEEPVKQVWDEDSMEEAFRFHFRIPNAELSKFQKKALLLMQKNESNIVTMPTGSGKSVLYEIAALTFYKDLTTIVILPTKYLMGQVERTTKKHGICVRRWRDSLFGGKPDPGLIIMSADDFKSARVRR